MLRGSFQIAGVTALFVAGGACASNALEAGGATGAGGAGVGGAGVTTSGTTSGEGGGKTGGVLAQACTMDEECAPDLFCAKASDSDHLFHGGPSNGYCTKACTSHADCPDGLCVQDPKDASIKECMRACTIGDTALMSVWQSIQPLDTTKCLGRNDLRCGERTEGQVCEPTCGSDANCPAGRTCDPRLAVCVDKPRLGSAMGAKCDPVNSNCMGVCIQFGPDQTMCSSPCSLGGETLQTMDCGGLDHGLCVFGPQKNGLGDAGFCTNACTLHSDCQNPLTWCFSVAGPDSQPLPNGYCFQPMACPNGDPDCSGTGLPCVPTPNGPFCVESSRFSGTGGAGGGSGI